MRRRREPDIAGGASKRRNLLSVKAEPASEDDFNTEARDELAQYASLKESEKRRQKVAHENKLRKERGEPTVALPKLAKFEGRRQSTHMGTRRRSRSASEESSWSGASRDIDEHVTTSNPRSRDDRLTYEGQVLLDFNPLYRLAGIEDPAWSSEQKNKAKNALLKRIQTEVNQESSRSRTRSPTSSTGAVAPAADDDSQDSIDHEVPEGDYDEEESVVVPWGQTVTGIDDLAEEEEGAYSDTQDPESVADCSEAPDPRKTSASSMFGNGTPSIRPVFPYTAEQARIGGLALDPDDPDIVVPASINRFLWPYQRDGARFLYIKYQLGIGGVLGDDMGLGKTIQVISFLSAIMRKTGTADDVDRRKTTIRSSGRNISSKHWPSALIVCPNTLISNWEKELDTWGYFEYRVWRTESRNETYKLFTHGYLDLLIVSFETARNSIEQLKELALSVVVVDEAHRMKEPRGRLALAMKQIMRASCFALTGTLVQNRIDEMWSVLDFEIEVERGWAGTLAQWRDFAVRPVKMGLRHEGTADVVVNGILRLGILHNIILPHFCLRRDKRLIAHELPEKRDLVVFCPLGSRQISAYQRFLLCEDVRFITQRNDVCSCGSDKRRNECCYSATSSGDSVQDLTLKCMNALTKIANHLGLLYHARDDSPKTRAINRKLFEVAVGEIYDPSRHSILNAALNVDNCGKWMLLKRFLQDWRAEGVGNKVLVFSNSIRLLKMIAEFIETSFSGFDFSMLTGEVDQRSRQSIVDDFQDPQKDHYILLISTMAGGVGLNLTAANKVVIFDPNWNPANDLQAMDRAFRIGQKRPVDVYRLIGKGTIEELMYERQIQKQQRSRQLNNGTFERRIHQGYEGARTKEDQGELFGSHNVFRFDPHGYVSKNLERVQNAEDKFLQDLLDAEYDYDQEDEDAVSDMDDGRPRRLRGERKAQAGRRMATSGPRTGHNIVNAVLGQDTDVAQNDAVTVSKIQLHSHEDAFKDSPEERAMFEIGLKLLHTNPDLAKKIKANDLGKLGGKMGASVLKKGKAREKTQRVDTNTEDEPWLERIAAPRKHVRSLAALSSDED